MIDGSAQWRRWWADLVAYRGALWSLVFRNVRSRYKQAALGAVWAVLQPSLQVVIFTVLFGILARIPSGDVPYPLFALAGLLPWNLFSKIVSEGAQSLVVNQNLISKLFFPRIYLVLAAGSSALLDAAVSCILLAAMMIFYGIMPRIGSLLALPAIAGVILFSYGFAALLAAVNARWRDVQHTLPFLLQIGLFATPVLYRTSLVPEHWRWVLSFNPLAGFVELFRSALLGQPLPSGSMLLASFSMCVAVAALGLWRFRVAESVVVDVV